MSAKDRMIEKELAKGAKKLAKLDAYASADAIFAIPGTSTDGRDIQGVLYVTPSLIGFAGKTLGSSRSVEYPLASVELTTEGLLVGKATLRTPGGKFVVKGIYKDMLPLLDRAVKDAKRAGHIA